jgi:hypothetical protein
MSESRVVQVINGGSDPGGRKMSESELSDYRLSVMARARGCNIHRVNNALQAVVMTNEFNMLAERDEKMKFISTLLA